MPYDLDFRSICLFIKTFTTNTQTSNGDPGHLDFLPNLYSASSERSSLRKALLAVSQKNVISRYSATELVKAATKAYVEALQSTNQALADPSEALQDETLATIYLLSLHEMLSSSFIAGDWQTHVQGLLQLLRMRGPQQFATPQGRQLFRAVHTPILIRALKRGEEPPVESIQIVQLFRTSIGVTSPFPSMASAYFYQVVIARARIAKLVRTQEQCNQALSTCQNTRYSIARLLSEAKTMDESNDLETLTASEPHWQLYRRDIHLYIRSHRDLILLSTLIVIIFSRLGFWPIGCECGQPACTCTIL